MADFNDLIRQRAEYKEVRQEKFKNDSRVRLSKILKKKVETTMIGALSSIEEHFSFLWTATHGEMTPEQQIMFDTFQKVRSEILDKGNTQSRNVDAELSQYDIKWLRYNATIPVKETKGGQEDG
tara:strand:- start:992 stop:1363 length:372 start_codon:yes stop_codon:yes gene_type:complete